LKANKQLYQIKWIGKGLSLFTVTLLLNEELHGSLVEPGRKLSEYVDFRHSNAPNGNSQIGTSGSTTETTRNENVRYEENTRGSFVEPCRKFNAHVDFLYWKADEDGLEYGTKMKANPIIGESSTTKTKLLDLHFEWDPGFRLGVGYAFDHFDCWALNLNWTHIHNHAHGSSSAKGIESQVGNVDTIISPWVNLLFELRSGASKASAHWHVDYDTLDLDFGRSIFLSKRFVINPYFGLRAAWIDQHYKAKYDSVFILAESAPPFKREVTFKGKNDFSGFGLRGGTEFMCLLSKNWHIFSQIAGNILYGKFRVHMKNLHDQGLGEGGIPPMPLNFKASEHLWRVRLSFEEAIGLGWDTFFRRERYRLRIRAAYELTQWLSQNELFYTFYFRGQDTISSVPIRSQGNLSFHGIRAGLQFDF
jgi:hypothetical protein